MMKPALKLCGLMALMVALAAFATGCNFGCKKAFKYRGALDTIEAKLADAVSHPPQIGDACAFLQAEGFKTLDSAAKFADRAAYSKFYYTETKCTAGYWTVRCNSYYGGGGHHYHPGHPGYPYPPYPPYHPPYTHCYDYYQCTNYQTIEHKLDGFEDARFVADQLRNSTVELNFACVKFKEGQQFLAAAQIAATNSRLTGTIKDKAQLALGKAGCYAKTESHDDVYGLKDGGINDASTNFGE